MNNPDHIEVDDTLLAKYLSGEASPEEAAAVSQWVSALPENRLLLEQAMTVWAGIPGKKAWELPDRKKWFKDLQEKLSRRSLRFLKRVHWMAAAILILIAGAVLWLVKPGNTSGEASSWITHSGGITTSPDTLPDHSVVRLGRYATIRYPDHFIGPSRKVLLRGHASFVVAKDPKMPFIVYVDGVNIKVLGTSFEIRPDTATISVKVLSGAVRMFRGDSGVTIGASHTGLYDKKSGRFSLASNVKPLVRSLNFENTSLQQIADKLEEAYNIRIIFENKQLENCTMSSRFDNKPLQFVLKVISITLNIGYRIDKNTVYFSGEGCN